MEETQDRPDNVTVYQGEDGEWRWRRRNGYNGEIVSTSGEGYVQRAHAVSMAKTLNVGIEVDVEGE